MIAAGLIVVLVSATALPAIVTLLLVEDPFAALKLANLLQIGLLFAVGHRWVRYSGASPWWTRVLIVLLGIALVLVSVALGERRDHRTGGATRRRLAA